MQFGIPLKPGIPAKVFEADSFKILAILVHGDTPMESFFLASQKGKAIGWVIVNLLLRTGQSWMMT